MIGITSRAVPGDFSIDLRATLQRVLKLFEHVDPRALTEHHS